VNNLRLVFLLALALIVGCATIHHTPSDFELEGDRPVVNASGSVSVEAADLPSQKFSIDLPGQTLTVDLREHTDAIVDRVRAALLAQGVRLEPQASKSLEIEAVYTNILPGAGRFHCVVDFTVRAGNGYVRGHQARDESYDARKACNAALSRAAFECLSDREIRDYLAGSNAEVSVERGGGQ